MKVKSVKKTLIKLLLLVLVLAGGAAGLGLGIRLTAPRTGTMPSIESYIVKGAERGYVTICLPVHLPKRGAKGTVYVDSLSVDKKGFEGDGYWEAGFFYLSSEADRKDDMLIKEKPFLVWLWKDGQSDDNPTILFDFDRDGLVDLKSTFEETRTKAIGPFKAPIERWCSVVDEVK